MKNTLAILALALVAGCKAADVATPTESAAREELLARQAQGEDVDAELAALDRSIETRAVGGVLDFLDPFIPVPLQPWKEELALMGAYLAFPRSRKHLGKGVKALAGADVKEAGKSVLRSVGMLHTSTVTAAAAAEAEASEVAATAAKAKEAGQA